MPRFATDAAWFNLRVAGVCIDDGRVLLHTEDRFDFWVLPGGRPHFGEAASDALRREMMEETRATGEVGRLLWVVENLFTHDGIPFHEIGFYFAMSPLPGLTVRDGHATFTGYEGGIPLRFQWFPLAALDSIRLLPGSLPTALRALPDVPLHIVQRG